MEQNSPLSPRKSILKSPKLRKNKDQFTSFQLSPVDNLSPTSSKKKTVIFKQFDEDADESIVKNNLQYQQSQNYNNNENDNQNNLSQQFSVAYDNNYNALNQDQSNNDVNALNDQDCYNYQVNHEELQQEISQQKQINFNDQVDSIIFRDSFITKQNQPSLQQIVQFARRNIQNQIEFETTADNLQKMLQKSKQRKNKLSFMQIAVELNKDQIQGNMQSQFKDISQIKTNTNNEQQQQQLTVEGSKFKVLQQDVDNLENRSIGSDVDFEDFTQYAQYLKAQNPQSLDEKIDFIIKKKIFDELQNYEKQLLKQNDDNLENIDQQREKDEITKQQQKELQQLLQKKYEEENSSQEIIQSYITFNNSQQSKKVSCARELQSSTNQYKIKSNLQNQNQDIQLTSYMYLRTLLWLNFVQVSSMILIISSEPNEWFAYMAQVLVTVCTFSTEFLGVVSQSENNKIFRQIFFLFLGGISIIYLIYLIFQISYIKTIKKEYTVFCLSEMCKSTIVKKRSDMIIKKMYQPYTKKMRTIYIIFAILYLPIIRNGLFIFTCYSNEKIRCWSNLNGVQIAVIVMSCIIALIFGIGFPTLTYSLIQSFSPTLNIFKEKAMPKFHDISCLKTCSGNCVEKNKNNPKYKFNIKRPLEDFQNEEPTKTLNEYQKKCVDDISPFAFLYQGYSYFYKFATIYFLIDKIIVVLALMIPLSQYFNISYTTRIALFTSFYMLHQLLTFLYSHFYCERKFSLIIDSKDDYIQSSMMISSSIMLLIYKNFAVRGHKFLLLYYIGLTIFYIGFFYTSIKFEKASFPRKKIYTSAQNKDILEKIHQKFKIKFSNKNFNWDLRTEAIRRVWMPFWLNLFKNDPHYGKGNFKQKLDSTYAENQFIALGSCYDRIKQMYDSLYDDQILSINLNYSLDFKNEYTIKLIKFIQQELEGDDVYWIGQLEDHSLPENSYFGKLKVEPFPIRVLICYDSFDIFLPIPSACWKDLCEINMQEEIIEKKMVRKKLRALCGKFINFQYTRIVKIQQGIGEIVNFICVFERGLLKINNKVTKDVEDLGFNVSLTLTDYKMIKEGLDFFNQRNYKKGKQVIILRHQDLGITPDFSLTDKLNKLFAQHNNYTLWSSNIQYLLNSEKEKRIQNMATRAANEAFISWMICPTFLTNIGINIKQISTLLQTYQGNIYNLIENYKEQTKYIYNLLNFFCRSPINAFWYIFFDDIWYNNYKQFIEIEENYQFLNPEYPNFIGIHVLQKDDLNSLLKYFKLDKIIPMELINKLYEKISYIWKERERFNICKNQFTFNQQFHIFPSKYLVSYKEDSFNQDKLLKQILPLELNDQQLSQKQIKQGLLNKMKKQTLFEQLEEIIAHLPQEEKEEYLAKYGSLLKQEYFKSASDSILITLKLPNYYFFGMEEEEIILPEGWLQKIDSDGRVYFANLNSRQTQFDFPGPTKTRNLNEFQIENEKLHGKLPPEFELHYSQLHQKEFYINNLERISTWTDPRTLDEYNLDLIKEEFEDPNNDENQEFQ